MEILNKALIGASLLLATLSMSPQVKAQTSVDISSVGSIAITSITSSDGNTVYNNGTAATGNITATNGVALLINFSGIINDLSSITAGEQILIPISTTASSHFAYLSLFVFNASLPDGLFTVSYSSNGNIILTATGNITGSAGSYTFNLQGSQTLYTTNDTKAQLAATSTTFILDNNSSLSYTINNTPTTLTTGKDCILSSSGGNSGMSSVVFSVTYTLYCIYNALASGELNASNLSSNPYLTTNLIEVETIPANTEITNITATLPTVLTQFMNYSVNDSVSISNMVSTTLGQKAFTANNSITDTSMASLEANLPVGQYTVINNGNGSYTLAANWGTLLNNPLLLFPSGFANTILSEFGDTVASRLVQESINDSLSAFINRIVPMTLFFADSTVKNSISLTVTSNIFPPTTGSGSTIPISNIATGQTTVKIHYVTTNGTPLQNVTVYYGYPVNNTMGVTPSAAVQAAPATIAGYTLVTNSAILDTITSIPAVSILTDAESINYPSSGTTDIYYVYAAPKATPITGLHLAAQVQTNNEVQLTWGTITEINSKSFTVQRSADNGKTWVNIGALPTQAQNGNSSTPLTYQLTDQYVPVGSYEYRVVETDINGSTTTSNVVPIQITAGAKVYPIPASTYIRIILPAGTNNVSYRMISTDGKVVLQGSMSNQGNFGQISVAGLASAVYFLQVTINNAVQTYKVQVQH